MWAPLDKSLGCGKTSNPIDGWETGGGKFRRRQTIKVTSKSAEESTCDPTKSRKNEIYYFVSHFLHNCHSKYSFIVFA